MSIILGHRGASGYAPENTLEAFRLAMDMGADGFELDVHLSKDGELIIMHDERVDRTTDGSGLILLYCGPKDERGFAAMHAGSMYQNVGLMCASLGLANCVKWQKHDALDRELPLPKGWQTFITHSIGKPAA